MNSKCILLPLLFDCDSECINIRVEEKQRVVEIKLLGTKLTNQNGINGKTH
jgi:hypothetical protein